MAPSERVRSAGEPVEVDFPKLAPGELMTLEWQGKPVWILHRTSEMIERLETLDTRLSDPKSEKPQQPEYCRNPSRSRKPYYCVAVAICTHLGCVPTFRKEVAPADLGSEWPGGFYCPCHGSKFDFAGRVFRNVPAPLNLEVPRHKYLADTRLLIGEDQDGTEAHNECGIQRRIEMLPSNGFDRTHRLPSFQAKSDSQGVGCALYPDG